MKRGQWYELPQSTKNSAVMWPEWKLPGDLGRLNSRPHEVSEKLTKACPQANETLWNVTFHLYNNFITMLLQAAFVLLSLPAIAFQASQLWYMNTNR